MSKIAILLHMGNFSLWSRYPPIFSNFSKTPYAYDIYINIIDPIPEHQVQVISRECPGAFIYRYKNSGRDIGGYLHLLHHIRDKNYDYILFLHTKTDDQWFYTMVNPICSSPDTINKCMEIFNHPQVGIIGSKVCIGRSDSCQKEKDNLLNLMRQINFPFEHKFDDIRYIAGTIFWMRFSVIQEFLNHYHVDLQRELSRFNDFDQSRISLPFIWERFFGFIAICLNYRIEGV